MVTVACVFIQKKLQKNNKKEMSFFSPCSVHLYVQFMCNHHHTHTSISSSSLPCQCQYCTWLDSFIKRRCEKRSLCSTTFAFLGHHIISIFYHHDCCFFARLTYKRPNTTLLSKIQRSYVKTECTYIWWTIRFGVCMTLIITLLIWERKWKLLFSKER